MTNKDSAVTPATANFARSSTMLAHNKIAMTVNVNSRHLDAFEKQAHPRISYRAENV